jgi:hypothetical protein
VTADKSGIADRQVMVMAIDSIRHFDSLFSTKKGFELGSVVGSLRCFDPYLIPLMRVVYIGLYLTSTSIVFRT